MRVTLTAEGIDFEFPAQAVIVSINHLGLQLTAMSIEEERNYLRCTFASNDAWIDWDKSSGIDHPLASFAEVFSFGATGYVRLFESLATAFMSWWRGPRPVIGTG